MKFVKVFAGVLVVLALAGAAGWQFFLKDQVAYAKVATAYGAKMVCSCRFVAGRDLASCMDDFTADVSAVRFTEAEGAITADVLGGMVSAKASHEPGLGCTLVRE